MSEEGYGQKLMEALSQVIIAEFLAVFNEELRVVVDAETETFGFERSDGKPKTENQKCWLDGVGIGHSALRVAISKAYGDGTVKISTVKNGDGTVKMLN